MIPRIRNLILLFLVGVLLTSSVGPIYAISGSLTTENKITLRATDDHFEGYPTVEGLKRMADLVNEWSEGRITIEVYPGAVLGSEKETIELTKMGVIDIDRVSIAPVVELYPKISVFALPYIFRDRNHYWEVLNGPIGQNILEELKSAGFIGLAYMDAGARSFYTIKKPIYKLEDLKGLKIRTQKSSVMIDTMKALGAKPVPMAFEEVYSALQTGVIDGAENNPPSYLETSHYEVAKYFSLDEHAMVPEIVLMSLKTWNKLSEEDRDIIKRAALEGQEYEIKLWIDLELKALEEVKAAGCTIIHPDKKPFMDIVEPIYEKYGKEYEELIEGIKAT